MRRTVLPCTLAMAAPVADVLQWMTRETTTFLHLAELQWVTRQQWVRCLAVLTLTSYGKVMCRAQVHQLPLPVLQVKRIRWPARSSTLALMITVFILQTTFHWWAACSSRWPRARTPSLGSAVSFVAEQYKNYRNSTLSSSTAIMPMKARMATALKMVIRLKPTQH